jgi:hypothetical protein
MAFLMQSGLPDGIFSNQKSQFGSISVGLAVEDVGIFYGHLVYYWPFGIFCLFYPPRIQSSTLGTNFTPGGKLMLLKTDLWCPVLI